MEPPIAERHPHDVKFGKEDGKNKGNSKFLMNPPIVKKDYYYWMRDDSRKNKKVIKYLEDENDYCDSIFLKTGMQVEKNKILADLRKYMVEDHNSIEVPDGELGYDSQYRFYKVFLKGKAYPMFYYKKGEKRVKYLDPNDLNIPKLNDVSEPVFSPSLNIFGYGIDRNGSEKYEINLVRFPGMEKIDHNLPKIIFSSFLLSDHEVFYLVEDEASRPYQLYRYDILTRANVLMYEVKDFEMQLQLELGEDFCSIVYIIESYSQSEVRVYWFDGPRKGLDILVKKMQKDVEYSVEIFGDYFVLRTNVGSYKNFGLKYCKIGGNRWRDLIPYDKDIFLESVNPVRNGLLLECRKNGEQFFRFLKTDGIKVVEDRIYKKWDGGYHINLVYYVYNSNKIIYGYQDMITPHTYYELDLETMKEVKLMEKETKNFDASRYKVERLCVKTRGVKVPIDILSLKDYKKGGKCLLYGYNSYGSNVEIKFDSKLFPLVDRGFMYAIANTRGSSYFGETYYEDGMMLKKMNTFKDFIKASEYLIKKGYCSKDGLSIEGRSAGGLLVSAVSVMRPDLYRNVLAGVPFVDVLVTMSDATIPLTTGEWLQWGNPNVRKYYKAMIKYSPIDNIREGVCYPNYYVQAGLNDPRVAYWEPAKFVATLRYSMGVKCSSVVVLKTEMEKGHFASKDRYRNLEEVAERYAFIIKN